MSNERPAETTGQDQDIRKVVAAMRRSYGVDGITDLGADPIAAFTTWLHEAAANQFIVEANAMVLSTLGSAPDGSDAISTRTVLLKDISEGGFTFFTNYNSRKSQAIELNSQVTLLFPWYAMERQVSISGFELLRNASVVITDRCMGICAIITACFTRRVRTAICRSSREVARGQRCSMSITLGRLPSSTDKYRVLAGSLLTLA
jgi:hypothetical protein